MMMRLSIFCYIYSACSLLMHMPMAKSFDEFSIDNEDAIKRKENEGIASTSNRNNPPPNGECTFVRRCLLFR